MAERMKGAREQGSKGEINCASAALREKKFGGFKSL